ncbi:unnamed protein product [Amoebophrya sp. A25]|nr:unnamed protein product [Amoebophrya sp. A25]|eukprot:GSA25T00021785001.1
MNHVVETLARRMSSSALDAKAKQGGGDLEGGHQGTLSDVEEESETDDDPTVLDPSLASPLMFLRPDNFDKAQLRSALQRLTEVPSYLRLLDGGAAAGSSRDTTFSIHGGVYHLGNMILCDIGNLMELLLRDTAREQQPAALVPGTATSGENTYNRGIVFCERAKASAQQELEQLRERRSMYREVMECVKEGTLPANMGDEYVTPSSGSPPNMVRVLYDMVMRDGVEPERNPKWMQQQITYPSLQHRGNLAHISLLQKQEKAPTVPEWKPRVVNNRPPKKLLNTIIPGEDGSSTAGETSGSAAGPATGAAVGADSADGGDKDFDTSPVITASMRAVMTASTKALLLKSNTKELSSANKDKLALDPMYTESAVLAAGDRVLKLRLPKEEEFKEKEIQMLGARLEMLATLHEVAEYVASHGVTHLLGLRAMSASFKTLLMRRYAQTAFAPAIRWSDILPTVQRMILRIDYPISSDPGMGKKDLFLKAMEAAGAGAGSTQSTPRATGKKAAAKKLLGAKKKAGAKGKAAAAKGKAAAGSEADDKTAQSEDKTGDAKKKKVATKKKAVLTKKKGDGDTDDHTDGAAPKMFYGGAESVDSSNSSNSTNSNSSSEDSKSSNSEDSEDSDSEDHNSNSDALSSDDQDLDFLTHTVSSPSLFLFNEDDGNSSEGGAKKKAPAKKKATSKKAGAGEKTKAKSGGESESGADDAAAAAKAKPKKKAAAGAPKKKAAKKGGSKSDGEADHGSEEAFLGKGTRSGMNTLGLAGKNAGGDLEKPYIPSTLANAGAVMLGTNKGACSAGALWTETLSNLKMLGKAKAKLAQQILRRMRKMLSIVDVILMERERRGKMMAVGATKRNAREADFLKLVLPPIGLEAWGSVLPPVPARLLDNRDYSCLLDNMDDPSTSGLATGAPRPSSGTSDAQQHGDANRNSATLGVDQNHGVPNHARASGSAVPNPRLTGGSISGGSPVEQPSADGAHFRNTIISDVGSPSVPLNRNTSSTLNASTSIYTNSNSKEKEDGARASTAGAAAGSTTTTEVDKTADLQRRFGANSSLAIQVHLAQKLTKQEIADGGARNYEELYKLQAGNFEGSAEDGGAGISKDGSKDRGSCSTSGNVVAVVHLHALHAMLHQDERQTVGTAFAPDYFKPKRAEAHYRSHATKEVIHGSAIYWAMVHRLQQRLEVCLGMRGGVMPHILVEETQKITQKLYAVYKNIPGASGWAPNGGKGGKNVNDSMASNGTTTIGASIQTFRSRNSSIHGAVNTKGRASSPLTALQAEKAGEADAGGQAIANNLLTHQLRSSMRTPQLAESEFAKHMARLHQLHDQPAKPNVLPIGSALQQEGGFLAALGARKSYMGGVMPQSRGLFAGGGLFGKKIDDETAEIRNQAGPGNASFFGQNLVQESIIQEENKKIGGAAPTMMQQIKFQAKIGIEALLMKDEQNNMDPQGGAEEQMTGSFQIAGNAVFPTNQLGDGPNERARIAAAVTANQSAGSASSGKNSRQVGNNNSSGSTGANRGDPTKSGRGQQGAQQSSSPSPKSSAQNMVTKMEKQWLAKQGSAEHGLDSISELGSLGSLQRNPSASLYGQVPKGPGAVKKALSNTANSPFSDNGVVAAIRDSKSMVDGNPNMRGSGGSMRGSSGMTRAARQSGGAHSMLARQSSGGGDGGSGGGAAAGGRSAGGRGLGKRRSLMESELEQELHQSKLTAMLNKKGEGGGDQSSENEAAVANDSEKDEEEHLTLSLLQGGENLPSGKQFGAAHAQATAAATSFLNDFLMNPANMANTGMRREGDGGRPRTATMALGRLSTLSGLMGQSGGYGTGVNADGTATRRRSSASNKQDAANLFQRGAPQQGTAAFNLPVSNTFAEASQKKADMISKRLAAAGLGATRMFSSLDINPQARRRLTQQQDLQRQLSSLEHDQTASVRSWAIHLVDAHVENMEMMKERRFMATHKNEFFRNANEYMELYLKYALHTVVKKETMPDVILHLEAFADLYPVAWHVLIAISKNKLDEVKRVLPYVPIRRKRSSGSGAGSEDEDGASDNLDEDDGTGVGGGGGSRVRSLIENITKRHQLSAADFKTDTLEDLHVMAVVLLFYPTHVLNIPDFASSFCRVIAEHMLLRVKELLEAKFTFRPPKSST